MLQVLRVNLNTKDVSTTEFDMNLKLGNRGLVAKTMTEEVDPNCEPLGKDNKLIFATGIFAGYGYPTGNRLSVGAKSPLTGGIKEANVGGTMGTYLANHGIKELILEDTADSWSIVFIDKDGKVTLKDASEFVGKGTYETVEKLYEVYGNKISACVIGPVGERLNLAASIQVPDSTTGHPSRAAGRGGLGAVMGSKKVKAVVCEAPAIKAELPVVNPEKLKNARIALNKGVAEASVGLRQAGTNSILEGVIPMNIIPVQNFSGRKLTEEETAKVCTAAYVERANSFGGKQGTHCQPGCPVQCSNVINDKDGNMITTGLEYETYTMGGINCNIFDIDYVAYFDKCCDDLGIDTIEAGNAVAIAMDAGYIPWGDIEKAKELVNEMYKGSEIGNALSNGAVGIGKYLKHDRVPQVKGQAFPAYDPRSLKGMGVTYLTTPMGADHTAGHTFFAQVDHAKPDFQVEVSKNAQMGTYIQDNVCCSFGAAALGMPESFEFAQAVFGDDIEPDFLEKAAVDTLKMELDFNKRAGFGPKDDVFPEFMYNQKTGATQTTFDVDQKEIEAIWSSL